MQFHKGFAAIQYTGVFCRDACAANANTWGRAAGIHVRMLAQHHRTAGLLSWETGVAVITDPFLFVPVLDSEPGGLLLDLPFKLLSVSYFPMIMFKFAAGTVLDEGYGPRASGHLK